MKILVLAYTAGLILSVTQEISDAASQVILIGTALGVAGGVLRFAWKSILRPAATVLRRTVAAVDVFEELPDRLQTINGRLDAIEQRLAAGDKRFQEIDAVLRRGADE